MGNTDASSKGPFSIAMLVYQGVSISLMSFYQESLSHENLSRSKRHRGQFFISQALILGPKLFWKLLFAHCQLTITHFLVEKAS